MICIEMLRSSPVRSRIWAILLAAGGLASFVEGANAATESPSASQPISLDEAIAVALSANESLAAARLKLPIARAGVDVARERPNPDLTLEASKETPREALTLAVPIETAGKRGRRIDLAEAGAFTAEAELGQSVLAVRNDVRRSFYSLLAAQQRSALARDLFELAERIHGAARERFEAGAAARLEVIQAELAAVQAENETVAAAASVVTARSAVNVLLARRPDHPTEIAGDFAAGEVPEPATAAEKAVASNADLALLDRRILEESARLDLARAQQWPDPLVGGSVTHRAQPEFDYGWRGALTVTLPIFHHHGAEVRVEEHTLVQLRTERTAAVSRLEGTVFSAVSVASAQRRQYLRFREQILPSADEVARMAEDAYRSGQTSLVAMVQSVQAVRDVRAKAIQAGLDYQNALADLERAVGAPLP